MNDKLVAMIIRHEGKNVDANGRHRMYKGTAPSSWQR